MSGEQGRVGHAGSHGKGPHAENGAAHSSAGLRSAKRKSGSATGSPPEASIMSFPLGGVSLRLLAKSQVAGIRRPIHQDGLAVANAAGEQQTA